MELDGKEKEESNNIVESSISSVEDVELHSLSKLKQVLSDEDHLPPSISPELTRRQLATIYIVCFVNFLKYMDRFTIAGILVQIQCDYNIGDAEGGLLSTVFVVAYMLCAPIFGYLGDRYSRKLLMAAGIFIWSLATLVGSFMPNYWSFLVMRVVVGVGEAMYSTVSPTLISDLCVGDRRSNFLIIYYFAIPVGSGLGFIVGSVVANALGSWRWGLRVTPILGAISVLLVLIVVQEPKRGVAEGSKLKPTSYWDDVKYLVKNKSYVTNTLAVTMVTYVSGGLAWWGPKYYSLGIAISQGPENVDVSSVSFLFGLTAAVAGVLGVWSGSFTGQKLRVRFPTADPLVCAWGMIISAPLMFWGLIMATGPQWATYTVITFAQWFMNVNWALSGDILLYIVIPTRRATAGAINILLSHAFGDACSPYIIGLVSDAFKVSLTAAQESKILYYTDARDNSSSVTQWPVFLDEDQTNNCTGSSTIDFDTIDVDYKSLQYSMMITTLLAVMGAFFFFVNAWYIVEDRRKTALAIAGEGIKRIENGKREINPGTGVICPNGLEIFDPDLHIVSDADSYSSQNNSKHVVNENFD